MFKVRSKINKDLPDAELMQLLAKGNRIAFEIIYDRYFYKLVGFCKRLLNEDEELAKDIVQEVFIKIIDKPESFSTHKVFSTWIYTLAKYLCFNHIRNEQNRKDLIQQNYQFEEATEIYPNTDSKLLKLKIAELYRSFNDKEKLIFILRFEQELSIKKIAEIAEIPEGSVKSGIYYLLKKIGLHLKEFKHEY